MAGIIKALKIIFPHTYNGVLISKIFYYLSVNSEKKIKMNSAMNPEKNLDKCILSLLSEDSHTDLICSFI